MHSNQDKSIPPADHCPLCSGAVAFYCKDTRREYFQCVVCELVSVPRAQHLKQTEEKAHYDLHQNCPSDQGYRAFLKRVFDPLTAKIEQDAAEQGRSISDFHGLDFGSGPGPTLSLMFEEDGYSMAIYDSFYAADDSVFLQQYDFITATEVVEHLSAPAVEINKLWQILKPDGWLGIMTKRVTGRDAFTTWHYKNDPTHIVFFSDGTFLWLADKLDAQLEFIGADVVLLKKPA
jgi:SAM-dependent methyltransferase